MKIAHLILAHSEPRQLGRLVDRLEHPGAYFFIHIDKGTSIEAFRFLQTKERVFLVADRVRVRWGAYSMVQATLNAFKEIIASGAEPDYVNLLSGADYPIKSNDEIHSFFAQHKGKSFMEFLLVEKEWKEAVSRLTSYHLTHYSFPGKYVVQKWINRLMPARTVPAGLVAVGRSQWFSITLEAVRYILEYLRDHPEVERFFRLTWAPDEIIFQTILYNSEFRKTLVNTNLRYIDWSAGKGSPEILTGKDKDKLLTSEALFARKFDAAKHPEILDLLDKNLELK